MRARDARRAENGAAGEQGLGGAAPDAVRRALRAFREAERRRAAAEAAADEAYDVREHLEHAAARAHRGDAEKTHAAVVRDARGWPTEANGRKLAVMRAEVEPVLQRAHAARDRAVSELDEIGVRWRRDDAAIALPEGEPASAHLDDAARRVEVAAERVLNAVAAFRRARKIRWFAAAGVGAAVIVALAVLGLQRMRQQRNAEHNDQAVAALAPVPGPTPPAANESAEPVRPRVTLQYQERADRERVVALYSTLKDGTDWRVGRPERILPDSVNRPEVYGGVRYFFVEDSALARTVCNRVRGALAARGYDVTFPLWPMVTLQRLGHFHARRGLIEVWISPLPPPTTGGNPEQMGRCGRD